MVIIGNHRDAWVFGAVDPSSATAILMEIAHGLGQLIKRGVWLLLCNESCSIGCSVCQTYY